MSYSRATCSADWKEPNQILFSVCKSAIPITHIPQFLCPMPLYYLYGGGGRSGKPGRRPWEEEDAAREEEDVLARRGEEDVLAGRE